jgi:hypothetical protein
MLIKCEVVNYEVVLSDGTIVNTNANSNPDLFWALKGGGDQFGESQYSSINVWSNFSRYCHEVHSEHLSYRKGNEVFNLTDHDVHLLLQVWGGVRTYRTDYTSQLLSATQDFTENCQDPRASMITTINLLLKGLDEFVAVFLFYDGPRPPTGIFDKFLVGIPYIVDQLQTQTYTELVCILLYGLPGNLSNSFSLLPMQTLVVFTAIAICFAYGRPHQNLPAHADFLGCHDSHSCRHQWNRSRQCELEQFLFLRDSSKVPPIAA